MTNRVVRYAEATAMQRLIRPPKLIHDYQLTGDAALMRLARAVHAADIDTELDTDPLGPGSLAIGRPTVTEHLDYESASLDGTRNRQQPRSPIAPRSGADPP